MFSKTLALAAILAITGTQAVPHVGAHHQHMHRRHNSLAHKSVHQNVARDDETYNLHVHNNCGETKHFGLYEITSDFQMNEKCDPHEVASGDSTTIQAGYKDIGLRLSATVWAPRTLPSL